MPRSITRSTSAEVEREVGGALALDDGRAGEPGDVAVQLIRRLERRDGAAGAAVGEQQRLQHLVRPVGGEDLLGAHPVEVGDRGAQLGSRRGRVAMPVDATQLGGERAR